MILLEKYIKAFLKEAASSAIIGLASDVTGKSQHQKAASYNVNMTELDSEEVLLKVLEKVDKYDKDIPRLEVSPEVSYDTPHGNYAYPLTIKSLKDIVEKGRIGGTSFAIERPFFHMFKKSDSLNSVEIQSDGSNNYRGNYDKDLRTIVHTAIMFSAAKNLEKNPTKHEVPEGDDEENKVINFNRTKRRIKRKIKANTTPYYVRDNVFFKTMKDLSEELSYLVNLNNKKYPREVVELIVDFLTSIMELKINSGLNKFFKSIQGKRKLLSKFHGLYYACWIISNAITDSPSDPTFEADDPNAFDVNKINKPQSEIRQGPVFTMLLNSIDIDFINDKGSGTLHSNEPIQAVYLNSSKKENVVLIGTFSNIFNIKKINSIDDLFSTYHQSSSSSSKGVTMNKIVNILEQNPQLNDLFGTELFDDVKLEHPLEDLREKAWEDLTKKNLKFMSFLKFHSANSIFNLNMYVGKYKLIVFDIGIKEKFLNASIEKQLKMIKREMPKIVKIEDSLTYIQVFLSKYRNKSIYSIKDLDSHNAIMEIIDKTMDYLANYEGSKDERDELLIMIRLFIYFTQEFAQLTNIATQSSLKNFN